MTTLIHADIFFFITSVVTVVLGVLFAIALFYICLILRDLRHLSGLVREGGEKLSEDMDGLREALKEEGVKIKSIFDFFLSLFIRRHKNKSGAKKKTHT